jgi:pimeloyl-ACP methyl ester carboxylesterase
MIKLLLALCLMLMSVTTTKAEVPAFPPGFRNETVQANGTSLHVRVGGSGPAVILIHGFGDTGDMWVPLAANLLRDHTVVVPDLRGMGLSSRPPGGYDKWTQAGDIRAVLTAASIQPLSLDMT